jgi:hypothetical protein
MLKEYWFIYSGAKLVAAHTLYKWVLPNWTVVQAGLYG